MSRRVSGQHGYSQGTLRSAWGMAAWARPMVGHRACRHGLGRVGEGHGQSEHVRRITCLCLHHPRPHPMHLLNLHPLCLNHTTHLFPTTHLLDVFTKTAVLAVGNTCGCGAGDGEDG